MPAPARRWTVARAPLPPPEPVRGASTERRGFDVWRKDALIHLALWAAIVTPLTLQALSLVAGRGGAEENSRPPRSDGLFLLSAWIATWTLHHVASALTLRRLVPDVRGTRGVLAASGRRLPIGLCAVVVSVPYAAVALLFALTATIAARGSLGVTFPLFWLWMGLPAAVTSAIVLAEGAGPWLARRRTRSLLALQGSTDVRVRFPFLLIGLVMLLGPLWVPQAVLDRGILIVALPVMLLGASVWGSVNASDYVALGAAADGRAVAEVFE
jgi:hypothetical protein